MIAVDTSSLVAFFKGEAGFDVDLLDKLIDNQSMVLPPSVVTELLSDPKSKSKIEAFIHDFPVLEITEGFWKRAGTLRSKIISKGFKSRLGDVLIAQACIDNKVALLTRDKDFRHYKSAGGLDILP